MLREECIMQEFYKDIIVGQKPNITAIGLLDQSLACQCLNLLSSWWASGFGLDYVSQTLVL